MAGKRPTGDEGHPLADVAGRIDALCMLYECIPDDISQGVKWALAEKRAVIAAIAEACKEREVLQRLERLEAEFRAMTERSGSGENPEPPSAQDSTRAL